jgi:hypothetical protein
MMPLEDIRCTLALCPNREDRKEAETQAVVYHCEVDRPGPGSAPSCRITPSMSTSTQLSTILPSTTRSMEWPTNSTRLPVGFTPSNSPRCAQKHQPVGHLLPCGDLLHVGTSVVWEGTTYLGHVTLKLIGKLGSHELIQRLQVAFANRLRDPVGQDLVLLCRH